MKFKKDRRSALKDNLIHFEGGDPKAKVKEQDPTLVEPDEFEIYCMDIFLQYDEFNDGFMQKGELMILIEFFEKKNLGDPKAREKLRAKIDKFKETDSIDFVSFAQLINDAGYDVDSLKALSYAIYDQKFGGSVANIFCGCFKKCLCFKLRIRGVKGFIKGIIKSEHEAKEAISYTVSEVSPDSEEHKPKVSDFAQAALKVQSDITEMLDKGSDFYLLYKVYQAGMVIINNPEEHQDQQGNFLWDKWSYQIVTIVMFCSLASNYLISFSSYIYLLLYKGYYNPENFKRLNCCQAASRFAILTFIGPLTFLFFQVSQVVCTIILFFTLFFGSAAVIRVQDKQFRMYEINFGLNVQEFDGFSLQQKISQLFFSSLPTSIMNILIIRGYLDCSKLVEESPGAIYLSLFLSFFNICSTLTQIYYESKGFEEAYLSYSMNCMNAKNGWIPFIHKIQSGFLNQSINYFLMSCQQPQLTMKLCYFKQYSYQFNDQTIQSLAQDLNLWQQNRASGIFPKSPIKYWLQLGGSVQNVSLNQLLQLLNGLGDDLIDISLTNVNWKRNIQNAKEARLIVEEPGQKYDARTPSHMPCLQICIDAEGYQQEKSNQGANDNLDISIKFDSHDDTQVDFSSRGHDQHPKSLLNSSRSEKWCLDFRPQQTYVNFEFKKPLELHYYMFTWANDCPGRDPVEWTVEFTTTDGSPEVFTHKAQTKQEPKRFDKEKFVLDQTIFAKSAKFTFIRNRGNEGLLQINEISFYVQNPECRKVDLLIKNSINLVSYHFELRKCFEELLQDGANPDIANIQGQSMLLYSILNKKTRSVNLLINHGADINMPSPNGISPIQAIIENDEFSLLKMMLQSKVDLNKKLIKDDKVSSKPISAIHYIAKRTRTDEQEERDDILYSLLNEFKISYVDDCEERQRIFRQTFRCFRLDYFPNGNKFNRVFPKLMRLIPNLKLSKQRDTKGNNFMHIILKAFSKEVGDYRTGYRLETVASLNYLRELPRIVQNEPEFTVDSLQEYLANHENGKSQIPLEIAMEKENTFGVLYALKYTKIDAMNEKREEFILDWLYKQGGRDLAEAEKEMQKTFGEENRLPVYVRWEDLRDGLSNLIADKEKLEKFFIDKAYEDHNIQILTNMNITNFDSSRIDPTKAKNNKDQGQEQRQALQIAGGIKAQMNNMIIENVAQKKVVKENWKVVFFIFTLELSATFDLAGDIYLLWAMLQKDTAWATLTVYCMITPYFVSYAPLVNYQIENWRVKKQEGLEVTGRMNALAWVTLTPGIILYLFLMDVVFLFISSVLTPVFVLIHFFTCGKVNFTQSLNSTDSIYEKCFEMKRLDVNGFRRLRTISQLVFESFPQIILQSYILWYSLQPEVIEKLNGEKLLGIDQYVIYASVIFAIFHMCMEAALLLAEAKACRTSFIHYLLICLNGRLGWVPFTNILQDQDAAKITEKNILDFDDINTKIPCGKYSLEYEFGDKTASTLSKEIMLLQQSPNRKERPCIKIGESLNKVSFSTFLNLLYFSHRRVNLDIDDVNFESMLKKSQKYLGEIQQAKDDNKGGQFLLSIVELGHLSLVMTIVKVCQLELGKVSDGEKLVGMAMRNKDMKMADFLLSQGIVINPQPIEGSPNVPEGYRHVYIDELFEDPKLWKAFKSKIPTWGIIAVMNGWTEGSGYGGKRVKDMNDRSKSGGITWMYVTEAYPVCDAVKQIYNLE